MDYAEAVFIEWIDPTRSLDDLTNAAKALTWEQQARNVMTVVVKDSFEIKSNMPGINHPPGLVVIFDALACPGRTAVAGDVVRVERPDGSDCEAAIDEVKDHGPVRSFYFRSLRKEDAPISSRLTWSDDGSTLRGVGRHAVAK